MKCGEYTLSNTNGSATQQAAIRVKRDGVILANVKVPHSNPLKWVRTRPQDPHRKELVRQLRENDVPADIIAQILTYTPPKKAQE